MIVPNKIDVEGITIPLMLAVIIWVWNVRPLRAYQLLYKNTSIELLKAFAMDF